MNTINIHRKNIALSNGTTQRQTFTPEQIKRRIIDLVNKETNDETVIVNFKLTKHANTGQNLFDEIKYKIAKQGVNIKFIGFKKLGKKAKAINLSRKSTTPTQ